MRSLRSISKAEAALRSGNTPAEHRKPLNLTHRPGILVFFCAKIKTDNIQKTFDELKNNSIKILGEITDNPVGKKHFLIQDPWNNLFEIIEDNVWFARGLKHTRGSGRCNYWCDRYLKNQSAFIRRS